MKTLIEAARMQEDREEGSKDGAPVKITIKNGKKPAEIYRTDLITAMKLPDHQIVAPGTYFDLSDTWRQEWERGVQVPVNEESLPQPSFSAVGSDKPCQTEFRMPCKLVKYGKKKEHVRQKSLLYDLDDEDVEWLKLLNRSRKNKGLELVDESLMEKAMECLEDQCYTNMGETISTAKGLSIEYDEDIVCDICRSPDCEDGNEILFCDVCDVAVHQACYGVQKVPLGSWVCKPCTQLLSDCPCLLCSTRGGAMKKTKTKGVEGWVHMSCALWIPEVKIGNVEKMEPISKIESITPGRRNLLCYICKEKRGACIQCSVKSCVTAFHVTCGFDSKLHMQTVWDESAPDGVRHVCYCSRHTEKRSGRSPRKPSASSLHSPLKSAQHPSPHTTPSKVRAREQEQRENLRQNRLRGMEEEFYKYADVEDLASELNITKELATTFHHFWTLKRKGREDAALLPPTAEQQERLSGRQIKPFQKATMEIERVVRLRQDLERIRNLCYMVEKREKRKRELTTAREAVFRKELEVVADTSGRMSLEDMRWARACCEKNFTQYEILQTLDLQLPERPKVNVKRGRKPKRRPVNRINEFVHTRVMSESDGNTSKHSGACDSADHNNTIFCDNMENGAKTSRAGIRSNSASSCEDVSNVVSDVKGTASRNCSTRSGSSNNADMSSDSDFEDKAATKAKRRASLRQQMCKSPKSKTGGIAFARSKSAEEPLRNLPESNAEFVRVTQGSKSDDESLVERMRKIPMSDTDAAKIIRSSHAESTASSSEHTGYSSPLQSKVKLNGIRVSARVNLPQIKDGLFAPRNQSRLRGSPNILQDSLSIDADRANNVTDGQVKRKRKRLFCELVEQRDEPESPRILRSRSIPLGEQQECNAICKKRVCRSNGILIPKCGEEICNADLSSPSDIQPEDDGKCEVRFTRSRSRTSCSDSSKSESSQNDISGVVRNTKLEENGSRPELRRTRTNSSHTGSTSADSTFVNSVVCNEETDESDGKCGSLTAGQESFLKQQVEVSDISSRTRSRSNASDFLSSPVKKDITVFHSLSADHNSKLSCRRESVLEEVDAERCRTLRPHARLASSSGALKASLCSPTKCSRFFDKLQQAATSRA